MNRIDGKWTVSFLVVMVLAVSAYVYESEVMQYVRIILESGYLKASFMLPILVIVFMHAIKMEAPMDNSVFVVRLGFVPLDVVLTSATYCAVAATACSLLEGAVVQQYFGDVEYFANFESLDIWVILGVSVLLLWYVILHMYILARELFFRGVPYKVSTKGWHDAST